MRERLLFESASIGERDFILLLLIALCFPPSVESFLFVLTSIAALILRLIYWGECSGVLQPFPLFCWRSSTCLAVLLLINSLALKSTLHLCPVSEALTLGRDLLHLLKLGIVPEEKGLTVVRMNCITLLLLLLFDYSWFSFILIFIYYSLIAFILIFIDSFHLF